jgi:predicted ABC-type ATPase
MATSVATSFRFDSTAPAATRVAERQAARLVTNISTETRKALRALITRSVSQGIPVYDAARAIRSMVGLTVQQAQAAMNYRAELIDSGLTLERVNRLVDTYARKKLHERALTIARTEVMSALNVGQIESARQAQAKGLLGNGTRKIWVATPDEKTCWVCGPMDGVSVPLADDFLTPGGPLPGPPAHPRCRCTQGLDPGSASQDSAPGPIADDATILGQMASAYQPVASSVDTLDRFKTSSGFTPERTRLHDAIIRSHFATARPVKAPVATILGGGPASGKSTIAKQAIRSTNHVTIDVDHIRTLLPEYAEGVLAKRANAAKITHEEASYIAKRVTAQAIEGRYSMVLDGTGDSSFESLARKVSAARASGARVVGRYVTIDTDEAVRRAKKRGDETGRYVPNTYIREVHKNISHVLPKAMRENLFDDVVLWETRGKRPLVVASASRRTGIVVKNQAAWDRFLAKAQE